MNCYVLISATLSSNTSTKLTSKCQAARYSFHFTKIFVTVQWKNLSDGTLATGIYTSSWIAPKADVHSQQRFFYMGHTGEVTVDQAHRGYNVANDASGFATVNPLFMKYGLKFRISRCTPTQLLFTCVYAARI